MRTDWGPAGPGPEAISGSDSLVDPKLRSPNLDLLRAAAALSVVLVHAHALGGFPVTAGAEVFSLEWARACAWYAAGAGVWLFFALSGYLIARPFVRRLVLGEPLPSLLGYAIRRGARIYPLYWVVLTLTILIRSGFGPHDGRLYFPLHYALVHNLIDGQKTAFVNVAWTLCIEVSFYVFVPVAALLIVRRSRRPVPASTLATLVGIAWLCSLGFNAIANSSLTLTYQREILPAAFGAFCPGILLAIGAHSLVGSRWRWWLQSLPAKPWSPILAVAVLLGAVLIEAGIKPGTISVAVSRQLTDLNRPLYAIAFGLIVAAALRSRPWGGPVRGVLDELGRLSYGIYLIHALVLYAFIFTTWGRGLLPMGFEGGTVQYFVHAVALLGVTLPLAWLSWHGFERPILQFAIRVAHRWEDRHTPAPVPGVAVSGRSWRSAAR